MGKWEYRTIVALAQKNIHFRQQNRVARTKNTYKLVYWCIDLIALKRRWSYLNKRGPTNYTKLTTNFRIKRSNI